MRKQNLPLQRLLTHDSLTALASDMRYADVTALYAAVGEHHVSAANVVSRLVAGLGGEEGTTEDLAEVTHPGATQIARTRSGGGGVVVAGMDDVWTKLAKCCTPVPGDPVVGFVTRGQGVSVHRADCPNLEALQGSRSASSRSRGRPTPRASSSSRSRSRRSTAHACSRTSRASFRTTTSTSSRRASPPRATVWP
ncbi:hypothetical protein GCM10025875_13670 [Litorihabitans aurantiacus]|uniref:RelA/SpoT AH and RIS domain-containing protein n=1 Tax=Litorihabitans aurantiacus TaxID=1930061 RepID=A0AA38CTD8_9MICO|nr:hypothetical protein GCM10025875_13670 [Litorihabitans aurantiacus]